MGSQFGFGLNLEFGIWYLEFFPLFVSQLQTHF